MIALPYPTALAAPLAGQTDAKDAPGRIDTSKTAGGLPVVCLEASGPVWLMTFESWDGSRRAWVIGNPAPVMASAARLLMRYAAQRCDCIDELLSDEGELC